MQKKKSFQCEIEDIGLCYNHKEINLVYSYTII